MSDIEERHRKIRENRARAAGRRWGEALGALQTRVREDPRADDYPDWFERLLRLYCEPLEAFADSMDSAALHYPGRRASRAAIKLWCAAVQTAGREIAVSADIKLKQREALALLAADVLDAGLALAGHANQAARGDHDTAGRWLADAAYRLGALEEQILHILSPDGRRRKAHRERVRARFAELKAQKPGRKAITLYNEVASMFDLDPDTVRRIVAPPRKAKRSNGKPPTE